MKTRARDILRWTAIETGALATRAEVLPTLLRRTLARAWASVRSEILWALIFVFMVGLGPFPGLLALGFHTGGVLGKLVGEVLEAVDPRPLEALQSTGASRLRILLYGVLPQSAPRLVSYALYRWEVTSAPRPSWGSSEPGGSASASTWASACSSITSC